MFKKILLYNFREAVEVNEEWIINKDSTETPSASNDPSDDEKEEDNQDEESSIIHMEEEESQIDFMEVVDDNDFLDNNDDQGDVAAGDNHNDVDNVLENDGVPVDVAADDNHDDFEDEIRENYGVPDDVAADDQGHVVDSDDVLVVVADDYNGDDVQDNVANKDFDKDMVLDNDNVSNQDVDYASEDCVENNVNIKEAIETCHDDLKDQDSSKDYSANLEGELTESIEFKHNIIDPAIGDGINESIGIKENNISSAIQDDCNDEQSQMVIDTDPKSVQGSINCSTSPNVINQNIVNPAIKVDNSIVDISNNLVPASDDLIKDLDYTNSGNLTLSSSSLQNEDKELLDGAIEDLDTSEIKDPILEEDIDFLNSSGESLGLGEGTDTFTDAQKKFIAANEAFMKANETVTEDKVHGIEARTDDFEDSDSESGRLVIDT